MQLKRLYDMPEGWEPHRDEQGNLLNAPPIKGLKLKHTGTHPEQNFSRRLVEAGVAEGWASMGRGKIVLHTEGEDLEYTIVRMPGTYCCFCDAKLDDDTTGALPRAHIAQQHAGETCADKSNPAGFRVTNAYECVLDEEQHAYWNAQVVAERIKAGEAPYAARGKGEDGEPYSPRRKRKANVEEG